MPPVEHLIAKGRMQSLISSSHQINASQPSQNSEVQPAQLGHCWVGQEIATRQLTGSGLVPGFLSLQVSVGIWASGS